MNPLRSAIGGLIQCPLCGRSGGHIGLGESVCTRCRNGAGDEFGLAPTRLHIWRTTLGWSVREMAEALGASVEILSRALRGDPVGKRTAKKLEALTGISHEHFLRGDRSPFAEAPWP